MAKARRDIAQEITDQFIAAIENGQADGQWSRPWTQLGEFPTNASTGKQYSGMNALLLMMAGSGQWATYKQWQGLEAQVIKGEKGLPIIRPLIGKDKTTGEDTMFGWAAATVFHSSQVEGYEAPTVTDRAFVPNQRADELLAASEADIRHGGDRAYYVPSQDYISMPEREQFDNEAAYYGTALHELVHWTGSDKRLDRKLNTGRFDSNAYAFEELVAELGAAFLSAITGVHQGYQVDHAKYIKGWLEIMKGDKNAIITAASQAQKAVDYIMECEESTSEEDVKAVA